MSAKEEAAQLRDEVIRLTRASFAAKDYTEWADLVAEMRKAMDAYVKALGKAMKAKGYN